MAEAALALSLISFLSFSLSRNRARLFRLGRMAIAAASIALLALVIYRSIRISFPALTGTYEGLVVLAWALSAFLVLAERRVLKSNHLVMAAGAFAVFLYLAILSSPLVSSELNPPVPILRSFWLVVHVAFSFIGIALFTAGTAAAVAGFFQQDSAKADAARDASVALGFVFYATGGLLFGAIWAEAAWGRFWGWDPKETWALITTLVYTAYLHLRYIGKIKPSLARVLVILAWLTALFTFWGVNALLPGLHSYA